MRYKAAFNLVLLIGISFISIETVSAQANLKDQNRKKDFGWSLKKFEKKGKERSKNKETLQENPQQSEAPDSETIRVETNLIVNDVLVVNEKGNAILGLKQSDFIVTEDKEPQKVELFSFGENAELPRSIVLIMRSIPNTAPTYDWMKNNSEATKVLVDKLGPNDKMAIVTSEQKLVLDFTLDKALLKKTIEKVSSDRNAKPYVRRDYGTLMAVLDEMFDERDARPIVIFQSGGGELHLLKGELLKFPQDNQDLWKGKLKDYYDQKLGGERGYTFSDVLERVEKSRATIYSIYPDMQFVGLPREEQLRRARISIGEWMKLAHKVKDPARISAAADQYQSIEVGEYVTHQTAMMKVAKLSGGYTEFIEKPEDAQRAYETIFTVINNRYTIGYYSTNQSRDGKRRFVKITVRGHPEYTIVGKESYLTLEGKE
jgi:VWFA-related protein